MSHSENSAAPSEIEVGALLKRIDRHDRLLLLDVRNEEEYGSWKIEGRQAVESVNVPYFDFIEDEAAAMAKIPEHQGDLIVVCAKGGSSAFVAELLRGAGTPATNLEGGMIAYGEFLQPVEVPVDSAGLFRLWQINRRGKGCLSYLVESAGEAIVVDPSRNLAVYDSLLERTGARLQRVLETHIQADHISGGPALAARHSIPYLVDAGADFELKQQAAPPKESEPITLGRVRIEVLHTPGHTPGSTSYLVAGRYLLSGDTLFTRAVGRPDLGGKAEQWARSLYHTLREKIGSLPPDTIVLPAHYSTSAEIGPDGVVSAKLGTLMQRLAEFHAASETAFVETMVRSVKTPPETYASIIRTNLGAEHPDPGQMTEWELGKNECAASAQH